MAGPDFQQPTNEVKTMAIPYQNATSGERALSELQGALSKFGCSTFGTMYDADAGKVIVQFKWREKMVSIEASFNGYATAWMKANPRTTRSRMPERDWKARAMEQARVSVYSVLRDWIKGQITAVEAGILSFEGAFLPHMLAADGERILDKVERGLLQLPMKGGSAE